MSPRGPPRGANTKGTLPNCAYPTSERATRSSSLLVASQTLATKGLTGILARAPEHCGRGCERKGAVR